MQREQRSPTTPTQDHNKKCEQLLIRLWPLKDGSSSQALPLDFQSGYTTTLHRQEGNSTTPQGTKAWRWWPLHWKKHVELH